MTSADTAIAIAKRGWPVGSKVVVVARDDFFTDALAGAPLAKYVFYKYGSAAPILLTNPNHLLSQTRAELRRTGAEMVYVLGGPGALSLNVEEALRAIPNIKSLKRVWGQTAYGTALAIKKEITNIAAQVGGPSPSTAIITTGENFPDALAISGAAAAKNMPILLVKPLRGEPEPETKEALKGIKKTVIIGGKAAVSQNLETWLNKSGYPVIKRLWGETEYETALDIATTGNSIFDFDFSTVLVTRGDYFTDALAGGPFAAILGPAPTILVKTDNIPERTSRWLVTNKDLFHLIYILGGWGAVSEDVVGQIGQLVE